MSYDIKLKDPVTNEVVLLPFNHLMIGGTFAADYDPDTGKFSPKPIKEATLNITYNYSGYYYDAAENDERFYGKDEYEETNEITNRGIRGIYGKTGAESIPMLKDMIQRICDAYKKDDDWITTKRDEVKYYKTQTNEEIHPIDTFRLNKEDFYKKDIVEEVYEGVNNNYWKATAGNAIRPLYKLIAMAELRPDGVWDGD